MAHQALPRLLLLLCDPNESKDLRDEATKALGELGAPNKEGMYTTLLMCTGLTFGGISALFGLTNHIIDQEQYTVLVTAVILSAVVPTLIAERWFQPEFRPLEEGSRRAAQ